MTILQLNLDDRTFDQLATEARALIARYYPTWTDYNASDPGITLLELFAFLAEAAIYQVNRVPERSLERFAGLVGVGRQPDEPIDQTLAHALAALSARDRAITDGDFETLVLGAGLDVARARALAIPLLAQAPNAGQASAASQLFPPADTVIKIIVVPTDPETDVAALCQKVFEFLKARTLLTTKIEVVPPDYTTVSLSAVVVRSDDSHVDANALTAAIVAKVSDFLDARIGGNDGNGWPFGRPLYRSELYRLIEQLGGIGHVAQLLMQDESSPEDDATREAIWVSPLSLVRLGEFAVTVI